MVWRRPAPRIGEKSLTFARFLYWLLLVHAWANGRSTAGAHVAKNARPRSGLLRVRPNENTPVLKTLVFDLVPVRGRSRRVQVVHLCSVVVRLRVGVETQLVVLPREHPEEVGVVAVPGGAKQTGGGRGGRCGGGPRGRAQLSSNTKNSVVGWNKNVRVHPQ